MKKNAKDQQKTAPSTSTAKPVGRLVERVARRVQKRSKAARTVNRAFVVVLKEEIGEALAKGFSVKDVWETLSEEGSVPFGYQAFRRHVNRVVLTAKPSTSDRVAAATQPGSSSAASPEKTSAAGTAAPKRKAGIAGFTFDPQPNPQELY